MDEVVVEYRIKELIDLGSDDWKDFLYVESNKAFEVYDSFNSSSPRRINISNVTYVFYEQSIDEVIGLLTDMLNGLRIAAIHRNPVDDNYKLIFQSRMPVEISEKEGGFRLRWRGDIDKMPAGYALSTEVTE